jgi:hypothetical protein
LFTKTICHTKEIEEESGTKTGCLHSVKQWRIYLCTRSDHIYMHQEKQDEETMAKARARANVATQDEER